MLCFLQFQPLTPPSQESPQTPNSPTPSQKSMGDASDFKRAIKTVSYIKFYKYTSNVKETFIIMISWFDNLLGVLANTRICITYFTQLKSRRNVSHIT